MKKISKIRKSKKISQVELAKSVGVKQATISRIEKGVNKPSLDVIERIAEALNVCIIELFDIPDLEARVLQSFREATPKRRAALLDLLSDD